MTYTQWFIKWREDLEHSFDIGIDPNGYPIEQDTFEEFLKAAWEQRQANDADDIAPPMKGVTL